MVVSNLRRSRSTRLSVPGARGGSSWNPNRCCAARRVQPHEEAGAIVAGYPSDATENGVPANITAAGYR